MIMILNDVHNLQNYEDDSDERQHRSNLNDTRKL